MKTLFFAFGIVALAATATAQIDLGTTDTSDGNLNAYAHNFRMDLAPTGVWNQPAPIPGRGVYDPNLWAVVYKFDDLVLGDFRMTPHPSGCPIVLLANNVNIYAGNNRVAQEAGGFFGGFPGQLGLGSAGLGLGGGQVGNGSAAPGDMGGSAGHGTAGSPYSSRAADSGSTYGNPAIIPLVGGSGGGAAYGQGGSYGGGAIMIAARQQIYLQGSIFAESSGTDRAGAGSGGSIRLIANQITGVTTAGALYARAFSSNYALGGVGRIRLEANSFGTWGTANPPASLATVGPVAKLWPANTDPAVKIATVNAINAPNDPGPAFQSPDVNLGNAGTYTVVVEARNVPTGGTWAVSVRGVPANGLATMYPCTFTSGNQAISYWSTSVPFTAGMQVLQARAKKN